MKTTAIYMDELRAKLGADSDFKALNALGVNHRQQVSQWRKMRGTFSEELSLKIAATLEIEPAVILLDMQIQRETNESVKRVWERIAAMMQTKEVAGIAAALAVFLFLPVTDFSDHGFNLAFVGMTAAPSLSSVLADSVYYVKSVIQLLDRAAGK